MAPMPHGNAQVRQRSRKNKFTELEDQQILSLVGADENSTNWELVAMALGTRTARQCKDRFHMYLAPGLNKTEWNAEEDKLLIDLVSKYGQKWKSFAPSFPGRPEISLKNRFRLLQRRNRNLIVGSMPLPQNSPLLQTEKQDEQNSSNALPDFDFFNSFGENLDLFSSFPFDEMGHPFF